MPMNGTTAEISVGHVLVLTRNAAKGVEFYRRLGLDVVGELKDLTIIELRGGTHILLSEFDLEQDVAPQKNIDLMIDSNLRADLEAYRAALVENGIEAGPISAEPRFGHYYFSVQDSDGNQLLFSTSHETKFGGASEAPDEPALANRNSPPPYQPQFA